jgi:hypothetical protein
MLRYFTLPPSKKEIVAPEQETRSPGLQSPLFRYDTAGANINLLQLRNDIVHTGPRYIPTSINANNCHFNQFCIFINHFMT